MKKILFLQRILASFIDILLICLPCQFVLFALYGKSGSHAYWLSLILFVLYNIVLTMHFSGQTIGKYFARLRVTPVSKSMLEMGQREAIKLVYFLPYFGFLFLILSTVTYLCEEKFLHDKLVGSEVIFVGKN